MTRGPGTGGTGARWALWLGGALLALVLVRLCLPVTTAATFAGGGCAQGAYAATPAPAILSHAAPAPPWGTYCAAGDGDLAVVRSTPFAAARAPLLDIAGYPTRDGMGVALVNTRTGDTVPVVLDADPRESWRTVRLVAPAAWGDARVSVEIRDGLAAPRGWVAVSGPYADPLGLSLLATLALAMAGAALVGAFVALRRETGAGRKALALVALLAVLVGLRLTTESRIISIDEEIPVMVSAAMEARGDLDPDWARTEMRDGFRYPSYNFYAYLTTAHGVIRLADAWRVPPINALRAFNVLLQLLAALLLFSALSRAPPAARWIAAAGFALAPMAVQDAYLARPESLIYLLTAAALWIALRVEDARARLAALAAVVAAGTAVKLTFLSVALLAAPALWTLWRSGPGAALRACALAGAVFAVTLFAAMPHALLDPATFLNGLRALTEQYAGGHAPHSLPAPDRLRFIGWIAGYFTVTLGGLFLLAPLALVHGRAQLDGAIAAAFASAALLFAYFATQNVFFERNFAHAVPLLIAVAAVGVAAISAAPLRLAAIIAALAAPLWWAPMVADASRHGDRAVRAEAGGPREGTPTVYFSTAEGCAGLVRFLDFNDAHSRAALADLLARGGVREETVPGRFRHIPTSTLQVYLEADSHYVRCPRR